MGIRNGAWGMGHWGMAHWALGSGKRGDWGRGEEWESGKIFLLPSSFFLLPSSFFLLPSLKLAQCALEAKTALQHGR